MKIISRARNNCALLSLIALLGCLCPGLVRGEGKVGDGRELFVHRWMPDDKLSPQGDGLGPMRNAASCVECHFQGGVGGGGSNDKNVDLMSAVPTKRKVAIHLNNIHPGFSAASTPSRTIVLHRFGVFDDYELFRLKMLGAQLRDDMDEAQRARVLRAHARRMEKREPVMNVTVEGRPFQITQRNAPALFGAGLIDKIDVAIVREIAREQPRRAEGVSGRVPPAGEFGRFGWRGQTTTLRDFVLGACGNELGLQNSASQQAIDPQRPHYQLADHDMTEQQCDDLVAFVAALPRPQQIIPARQDQASLVNYGQRLFHSIGCAVCHVPDVGGVDGLFSDLLLHDMGSSLADPLPAQPQIMHAGQELVNVSGGGGYFGGGGLFQVPVDRFVTVPTAVQQEWRTPPLWGVRDSAPYLHDGRAATLAQAIALHGGEAQFAARSFLSLPTEDRAMLIAFLNTLAAPQFAQ